MESNEKTFGGLKLSGFFMLFLLFILLVWSVFLFTLNISGDFYLVY